MESYNKAKRIISYNRDIVGKLVQFISGHNYFNRHQNLIDGNTDPTCRYCLEEEETTSHLVGNCPALWAKRGQIFYVWTLSTAMPKWGPLQIVTFINSLMDPAGL